MQEYSCRGKYIIPPLKKKQLERGGYFEFLKKSKALPTVTQFKEPAYFSIPTDSKEIEGGKSPSIICILRPAILNYGLIEIYGLHVPENS